MLLFYVLSNDKTSHYVACPISVYRNFTFNASIFMMDIKTAIILFLYCKEISPRHNPNNINRLLAKVTFFTLLKTASPPQSSAAGALMQEV